MGGTVELPGEFAIEWGLWVMLFNLHFGNTFFRVSWWAWWVKLPLSLGLGGEVGQQQGSSQSSRAFPAPEAGAWANLQCASSSVAGCTVLPPLLCPVQGLHDIQHCFHLRCYIWIIKVNHVLEWAWEGLPSIKKSGVKTRGSVSFHLLSLLHFAHLLSPQQSDAFLPAWGFKKYQ